MKKKNKKLRYILIVFFVIIFCSVSGFIFSYKIQTWTANKICKYFTKTTGGKTTIGNVEFSFFNSFIINDLCIKDLSKDTLLYIKKLKITVDSFYITENKVFIKTIIFKNPKINIKVDSSGISNYKFILDFFTSSKTKKTSNSDFQFFCSKLIIENADVSYKNIQKIESNNIDKNLFDANNFRFTKLNSTFENIEIDNNSKNFEIKNTSFIEQCGIYLKKLNFKNKISKNQICISNFDLETENSKINLDTIQFDFKNISDFDDFEKRIKNTINLNYSKINTKDLAYFISIFKNSNEFFEISTKINSVKGNKTKLKQLEFTFSDNIKLEADIELSGLSNFDSLKLVASINNFEIDVDKIQKLSIPESLKKILNKPTEFSKLKKMKYSGKISGNSNNLKSKGLLKTQAGNIDLTFEYIADSLLKTKDIQLNFATVNFNPNLIYKSLKVNSISINSNNSIHFKNNELLNYNSNTIINNISLGKINCKNIKILSSLNNKNLTNSIQINDSNLVLDSEIKYSEKDKIPSTTIYVNIEHINLKNLNLDSIPKKSIFKGVIAGKINGTNFDNFEGDIGINEASYETEIGVLPLNYFILTSKYTGFERIINIESDYVDIDIRGNFKIKTLKNSLYKFISEYIPAFQNNKDSLLKDDTNKEIINFTADFKNIKKVNNFFFPKIKVSDSLHFEAFFRTSDQHLDFMGEIPNVTFETNEIKNFKIQGLTSEKKLNIEANCQLSMYNNEINIERIIYTADVENNKIISVLSWNNKDSIIYGGDFSAITTFEENSELQIPTIKTTILPTQFIIAGLAWNIKGNSITYNNGNILLNGIEIKSGKQELFLSGKIDNNPSVPLNITINNFELKTLSNFIDNKKVDFSGIFSGEIECYNLLEKPIFTGISSISNFKINEINFGDLSIITERDIINKRIILNAFSQNSKNRFITDGNIFDNGEIALTANIFQMDSKIIKPFIKEDITLNSGNVSGLLQINGTTKNILWSGSMKLDSISLRMNYLGTDFNFSSIIYVDNDIMEIGETKIYDLYNNYAIFSANATHSNFENMNFNVDFKTDKFLVLNKEPALTNDFYGQIYTSGKALISGTYDDLKIKSNLNTLPGSEIYIQSANTELSEHQNYYDFKNLNTISDTLFKKEKISGINLDLQLNILTGTKINIMIDPATENVLKTEGSGSMNFLSDKNGNIDIFGDYNIEYGKYNFNIKKLSGLNFNIEPGSKIKWNGSPEDANIDITCTYKIRKAGIYDLLLEENTKGMSIPVDCQIFLKDKIMSPKIHFGILPKQTEQRIETMIKNLPDDEINKQFISLLLIKKFRPLPGLVKTENQLLNNNINPLEILTGQIGSALSSISDNVDIGLYYRQYDEQKSDEMELDISTGFLNDRITLNGNIAKGEYKNSTNNVVGDFDAEVKLTRDGKIKMKVFNKSNRNITFETGPYTQGFGFFYRKEFNKIFDKKNKHHN